MASANAPTIRPILHKREQIGQYRKDPRSCFIEDYLNLSEGRCVAIPSHSNTKCLNSLSQWHEDVWKVVEAANNPAFHSEPLEYEIDQIAAYFVCGRHQDQDASRDYWLRLFALYRAEYHVDIEMVDV
jgi:hypothetical protein